MDIEPDITDADIRSLVEQAIRVGAAQHNDNKRRSEIISAAAKYLRCEYPDLVRKELSLGHSMTQSKFSDRDVATEVARRLATAGYRAVLVVSETVARHAMPEFIVVVRGLNGPIT